jgi:hypothetical protein
LLVRIQRGDQASGHRMGGRDELLQRFVAPRRQLDRLAPPIARVAFAANQPARCETGDDLSHGRAVERDPLSEGALVDVRLAV